LDLVHFIDKNQSNYVELDEFLDVFGAATDVSVKAENKSMNF
jgi:hypothetical protein